MTRAGDHHYQAADQGDCKSPKQYRLFFFFVFSAQCLRHQTRCAGPQEIERRENQIDDDGTNRQTANQRGITKLSHDSRIHQSEQRCGDIGKRHRQCQKKYSLVTYLERFSCAYRRFAHPDRFTAPFSKDA